MRRIFLFLFCCACAISAQDGAGIYRARCAACHDKPAGRVPTLSALQAMTPAAIVNTLERGSMKTQAAGLTEAERTAVADYLGHAGPKPESPRANACPAGETNRALKNTRFAWTNWGVNSENTRFQTLEGAGLNVAGIPKLKLKWAFSLGKGMAPRSQPAIAFGRVFVGGERDLYALDAQSGCTEWVFHPDEPVRSGISVSIDQQAVFFGSHASVYAVNAGTGKLLWKKQADTHPAAIITATPAIHAGVLYVGVSSFEEVLAASPQYVCCTFRGSVVALNAATGDQLWKTYTTAEPAPGKHNASGAAVWSTPTFDEKRNVLYVSTGDNYSDPATKTSDAILALDAKTGKLLWTQQATPGDIYNIGCDTGVKSNCPASHGRDFDFGQPPMLVSLGNGKRALVIGQKSGIVYAFDPDAGGTPIWSRRIGQGGALGGIQWGSAAEAGRVFVALSDVRLGTASDKSSPQGFRLVLDPAKGGGLFALDAATGEVAWSAKPSSCEGRKLCSPAQSAPVTAIPGAVLSGSVDGHLRAYSAETGAILWDVNTVRKYDAVNGGKAQGGSLDVTGPVAAGGMIYVTSGYGTWGGTPGDALLAFGESK
ncbi:MAG TPA: PQQ-binding-like beta-propeller repeat protein [Bryobacteraceae bacterium]